MHTQHTVRLLLDDKLDKAVRLVVRLRTRVGQEGELADLVRDALLLERLLRLADPRHLRVRVDHRRNHVVVHVAEAVLDQLDGRNALFLGLVRQHRTERRITNALDALARRVVLVINHDAATLVHLDTHGLKVQATRHRATTDRHEHHIRFQLLRLAILLHLSLDRHLVAAFLDRRHLRAELKLETLLLQNLLERSHQLTIHARTTNRVLELDHRHLRTQTAPHTAELQTNHTAANHDQLLRHLLERQRTRRAHNLLLINLHTRERRHLTARSNDHILRLDLRPATVQQLHVQRRRRGKAAHTLDVVDLVLLQQHLHSLGKARHSLVLGLHHRGQVQRHALDVHTTLLQTVRHIVVNVRVVQHGLRRDTSHIQTRTTQRATLLNAGRSQTQLARLDGRHIATRATTNHDHIVRLRARGQTTRRHHTRERHGLHGPHRHTCATRQESTQHRRSTKETCLGRMPAKGLPARIHPIQTSTLRHASRSTILMENRRGWGASCVIVGRGATSRAVSFGYAFSSQSAT